MSANRILLLSVDSSLAQRIDDAMNGRATTELAQALTPELIKRPSSCWTATPSRLSVRWRLRSAS